MTKSRVLCGMLVALVALPGWGEPLASSRANDAPDEVGSQTPCTRDGWCHLNPGLHGLRSVFSVDAHHAFALGPSEHVVHWDDGTARYVPSNTIRRLNRVWAASATDAWAVGELGTIVHWDGLRWSPVLGIPFTWDSLEVIFGTGPTDVWVGASEWLLHWDGFRWTQVEKPHAWRATALWSSGPGTLWLALSTEGGVHHFGRVYHWTGTSWHLVGDFNQTVEALWGFGPKDVWVGGSKGLLGHWDGTAWRFVPGLDPDPDASRIVALWGRDSEDLWVAGGGLQHWDGQELKTVVPGVMWFRSFQAITGDAQGPLLAIDVGGALLRQEDGRWDLAPPLEPHSSRWVRDVWAAAPDSLWAAVEGRMPQHWNGKEWSPLVLADFNPTTITGTSASDVWAAGEGWGASRARIAHFDGREWTQGVLPGEARPAGSWALDENTAWVVGDQGFIWRWNGRQWKTLARLGSSNLLAVHASSPEDVWAVGYGGALYQWNGRQWVNHSFKDYRTFTSVWSFGPNDVWFGTDAYGVGMMHWDGKSFQRVGVGYAKDLYGTSPDDLWVVGGYGLVAHWNGTKWSAESSGSDNDVEWLTGARGTVFVRDRVRTFVKQTLTTVPPSGE